jgi:hypothetical protein
METQRDLVEQALQSAKLLWLLGPPGAGKTTWSKQQAKRLAGLRVVELGQLLAPFQLPNQGRPGMMRAKGAMIEALRALAHAPEAPERFLVIAVDVPQESLCPVRPDECVLLLRPEPERWQRQLSARPTRVAPSATLEQAADIDQRLQSWKHGLLRVSTDFDPSLLGQSSD